MEQCIENECILVALVINVINTDRSCFKTVAKTCVFGHARSRTVEQTMIWMMDVSKSLKKQWSCSPQAANLVRELH